MHDYMKALYHRFEDPSERVEELEEMVDKTHKQLAKQLGNQQRRLLLRLVDLEAALRDQSCLDSFMSGYRVAHGIHQELLADRPPYNFEQKLIYSNPAEACALPKVEHREMKTLPVEQLTSFLREAKETGVYEMYYIELATGLRRGELLGLKWDDIDMTNRTIRVQRQVARIDGEIVEAPLKTKNSYRTVSIGPDAIGVLKEQRKKVGREIEYVFPSPSGGAISPDSVLNMLHRVLERAGLPKIRFHDFRHFFATLTLQNGVDIKTVSGMLGHFSAGFTLDTYAHVTTAAQKEAANTMGNVLAGTTQNG